MATIFIPDHFYYKLDGWQLKLPLIRNKSLNLSLAINDYDMKLKKLSSDQLKKLDSENKKLCVSWIESHIISGRPRGMWSK